MMEPSTQMLFGITALLAGSRLNFIAAREVFRDSESSPWLHGLDLACGATAVLLGVSLVFGAVGRLW